MAASSLLLKPEQRGCGLVALLKFSYGGDSLLDSAAQDALLFVSLCGENLLSSQQGSASVRWCYRNKSFGATLLFHEKNYDDPSSVRVFNTADDQGSKLAAFFEGVDDMFDEMSEEMARPAVPLLGQLAHCRTALGIPTQHRVNFVDTVHESNMYRTNEEQFQISHGNHYQPPSKKGFTVNLLSLKCVLNILIQMKPEEKLQNKSSSISSLLASLPPYSQRISSAELVIKGSSSLIPVYYSSSQPSSTTAYKSVLRLTIVHINC
ncbi:hypothetical protein DAPPUDRAFT_251770 [Daphnia pulex]|uniref:Uncharacterized protein n=1 Tax=Daphnia pulex TaxID=6669 RepID=E9H136_DAPPU|nr:hypothetical protein DAPPUDRAFT_251770 [Daphnia pulex]|eukprot:EFX74561.1 hypothetical protein DAPPUDRAFT_251770 [Daphnia pulex]